MFILIFFAGFVALRKINLTENRNWG